MNYLLDKKTKQRRYYYTAFFVIFLFVLFYFRAIVFNGFSFGSHAIFRPVINLGNNIGDKFKSMGAYFAFKSSLSRENEDLQSKLNEDQAQMANYNSILAENTELKETLARKNERTPMTLAAILSKPNQSPYDTLVIDVGTNQGIKTGDTVFAFGNVPIGRVDAVYGNSSKAILFSNNGEKTQVIVGASDAFMEIVGRGGGNFEMILPRDFTLQKGDEVVLPGITPYVVAKVETTISDLRNPFQKALLVSPVNIQELKFVEVEI